MTWRVWRARHNVTDALKEPIVLYSHSLLFKSIAACITSIAVLTWMQSVLQTSQSWQVCTFIAYWIVSCRVLSVFLYLCPFLAGSKGFDFHPSNCSVMFSVRVCVKCVWIHWRLKKKNVSFINPEMINVFHKASCSGNSRWTQIKTLSVSFHMC